MKNVSLSQRIYLSFLLIVGAIMLCGALFYQRAQINEANVRSIEQSDFKGMDMARDIRRETADHWTELNQIVLDVKLAPENSAQVLASGSTRLQSMEKNIHASYQEYATTITLEKDSVLYKELQNQLDLYFELSKTTLKQTEAVTNEPLTHALSQGKQAWFTVRDTLNEMVNLNENSFNTNLDLLQAGITRNVYVVFSGILMAILIALACGFFLRRAIMAPIASVLSGMQKMGEGELTHRIAEHNNDEFGTIIKGFNSMAESLKELVLQTQGSAVQLATSITELAATSKQQQATVTETAATTAEIGATSKQIAATAKQLLQTVNETAETADQTARLAQTSQTSVSNMDDVMRQLSSAAEMVSGKLALLNERATGINQVVITIMKVADQTNLLSLNAAIEAEKAGEYGKGFTVVANEIRRLADQTAIATFDIEQMVREIQSAVAAGVMGIDKFSEEVRRGSADMVHISEQLSRIIEQVQELAPHIQQVNEGMSQQTEGAEQINLALSQLTDATSQTVESLVQTTATVDNMTDIASKLRSGVNRFKV
ncbi:methyl-accepting chemotaxis protein [Rheinheimera sp.]|uniref:methyl-accepting chemotaxis protein n=1 Tax=Rheinheimera sp. TaxID=1869214 RepID=UPI00307E1C43